MKTRTLAIVVSVVILSGVALFPAAASAQTVGVMMAQGAYDHERIHEAFLSHLREIGYADKIKILQQRPYPDPIALSNAARKLIASDVDILVVYGASPTQAVLREKPRIPVLYAGVYEPIIADFKSKYAAGVCTKLNISSLVRYLRSSTRINTMGVVYYSMESDSKYQMEELKKLSGKYGFDVDALDLKYKANLTQMLEDSDADAFIITSSLVAHSALPTILHVAAANKIPTASLVSNEDSAALITLTAEPDDQGKRLAQMVIDLSKGKQVQSLELYCARRIELVYNVKEANRMGLKVSMDLVTEATRLINK